MLIQRVLSITSTFTKLISKSFFGISKLPDFFAKSTQPVMSKSPLTLMSIHRVNIPALTFVKPGTMLIK